MGFFDRINEGLSRSRTKFRESMNVLLDRGPDLDEEFWDGLEETLILSDIGVVAADEIVSNLRDQATRQALPDAYAVLDLLNDEIAQTFTEGGEAILGDERALILFVGINGTGKTTTVGKIAKEQTDAGRQVILGSADTFRAAAIEQLEVWARRAGVEMVTRERGSDPASVCYDTIERAEATDADLVLIDTAGRLHTSTDLMRELEKVVNVVRKRSKLPVYTVLVIDATTGQNGLQQAREFNRALDLDALIMTKLDGTAKGGIALAVSHELELPIIKIGVGEGIDDLRDFNAHDFALALVGGFDERFEEQEELSGENAKEAAVSAGERRLDVLHGAVETKEVVKQAVATLDAQVGSEDEVEHLVCDTELADDDELEAKINALDLDKLEQDVVQDPTSEFTDEELADLALAALEAETLAADAGAETAFEVDEAAAEKEPDEQPEAPTTKKRFWDRFRH